MAEDHLEIVNVKGGKILRSGKDTDGPRDWEPASFTNAEVYARSHPTVKVVITFLDKETRTYGAIRAVEVLSSRMNCRTIKSVVCEDKAFEGMLRKLNELI